MERLEAERARRISEKIEKGEAVRMPVLIVGSRESIDAVRARTLAAMRAAGEKREVVSYDDGQKQVIITGVPRPGREPENYKPPVSSEPQPTPSIFDRRSAGSAPPFAVSEPQSTAPKQMAEPSGIEWRRVWATVERPSETNPGGAIVEGLYRVEDGMVRVTTLDGRPIGSAAFRHGDDVEASARKILREKRRLAVSMIQSNIPRHRCINRASIHDNDQSHVDTFDRTNSPFIPRKLNRHIKIRRLRGWSRREGAVMRNFYLRNPQGFDRWLKANAILGSLLAIGMLAMALASLNLAAELSSVTALK